MAISLPHAQYLLKVHSMQGGGSRNWSRGMHVPKGRLAGRGSGGMLPWESSEFEVLSPAFQGISGRTLQRQHQLT